MNKIWQKSEYVKFKYFERKIKSTFADWCRFWKYSSTRRWCEVISSRVLYEQISKTC